MHLFRLYAKAYAGISRPVWMLSVVLLINRSGTMVLPFLSIYLKDELGLDLSQVGVVLAMFGFGSLIGSWLGGFLTDRIGSFAVQFASLLLGGVGFFALFHVKSFEGLAVGFFVVTVFADMLRPANATAISEYAHPENLTRAFSLNRMAINLGYAIGPAVGGFLALSGYKWLFYADGATCIAAGLLFAAFFLKREKRKKKTTDEPATAPLPSMIRDLSFMAFGVLTMGFAVVFFQLFNTLPLFYRDVYVLPENHIGWLLAFNGLLVFLLEMPLVYSLGSRYSIRRVVVVGVLLAGLSYLLLNVGHAVAILFVAMAVLSVSEILVMPYLTTYTITKAGPANRGKYMGFYSMAYSAAFIVAPLLGTAIIDSWHFTALWYAMAALSVLVALGFVFNMRHMKAKPELAKVVETA